MDKLSDMAKRHAKEMERLKAELALANACPVEPKRVQITSNSLADWIIYESDGLESALDIMAAYEPIPFGKYKKGFTRLMPESMAGPEWSETDGCSYIASLSVSQGAGFGPDIVLKFYAILAGKPCQIHVNANKFGYGGKYGARLIMAHNGNTVIDWRANNILAGLTDNYIKWGSASKYSAHYEYLLAADYIDGGNNHASGQLRNIAESK